MIEIGQQRVAPRRRVKTLPLGSNKFRGKEKSFLGACRPVGKSYKACISASRRNCGVYIAFHQTTRQKLAASSAANVRCV